jgi:L-alanine-DL-glutamate epimerase-like enolase superfamily enzyme
MNRMQLADELRKTADLLDAGFEVDRGGITIAEAIAELRLLSKDEYFVLNLKIGCHPGDPARANWEAYGMTNPHKTFTSPSLYGLIAAVRGHVAEPATVEAVSEEVGRDASVAL